MNPAAPNSKDRLRRTKSARSFRKSRPPSVPPPPEPLDLELIKQHATTAASRAMLRSSERSSAESRGSYDRLGGPGSVAVPQRRRASGNIQWSDDSSSTSHAPVASRQLTRQSESYGGSHDQDQTSPAALPPINEFRGLDGRDSSLPSSYRRLRRAKSMFSTRHRPFHGLSSPRDGDDDGSVGAAQPRTLRRSMSFLRGQPPRTLRHAKSQDASIQMARSQFLHNAETHGQLERRPSLLSAKQRREPKPFRKSFRASSAPGIGSNGVPSWSDPARNAGFHEKARTLSQTIKTGFKRVFGKHKSADQESPVRTISILQPHWGPQSTESGPEPDYTPENRPPNVGLQNVTEYPEYTSRSRPRTIRSTRSSDSMATSNSRVTSWADSTAAPTVITRRAPDASSLAIIEEYEDGDRTAQGTPVGPASPDRKFDSHRLYSALIKRIGRGNMEAPGDGMTYGTVKEHRLVPERTSSAYSHRSRHTLRHIGSNGSLVSPGSYFTARGDTLSPPKRAQRQSRHIESIPEGECPSGQENDKFQSLSPSDSGSVVVSKPKDVPFEPLSPSVYSRPTNPNTPARGERIPSESYQEEEPGMVTILSSQRGAYGSPKRAADALSPGVPIQPSADWQKWVNSQMEQMDTFTPTREHFRENAQMHDNDFSMLQPVRVPVSDGHYQILSDDQDGFPLDASNPWIADNSSGNFSRPFSRSSSARTIVPEKKSARPGSSVFPSPEPAEQGGGRAVPAHNAFEERFALSPMFSRTNMLQPPESPTPRRDAAEIRQRRAAYEQYRRYGTRRQPLSDGKNAHRDSQEQRKITNENIRTEEGRGDMADQYHRLRDIHSTISSKRMVDMFLDSRRQQANTDASDSSAGAFL